MTKKKLGGRPPLTPGEKSVIIVFRATSGQRAKLIGLGGGKWIRGKIDAMGVK